MNSRASRTDKVIAYLMRDQSGLSTAKIEAAKQFLLAAKAQGVDVTIPEAIDYLSRNATFVGSTMLLVEQAPAGQAVTAPFFAKRAGQISAAFEKALDAIAPATTDPRTAGLNAQTAAANGIKAVEQDINAGAKPLLDASAPTLVPPDVFVAINTPAFAFSLARLRDSPVLGPRYAHFPDNSVGVIDAVTKDMVDQGEFVMNPVSADYSPQKGAILASDADIARTVAGRVDPVYAQALAQQAAARRDVLAPLMASSAGDIANTSDIKAQTAALFPANPYPGADADTTVVVRMMEGQIPGSAAALVRAHLSINSTKARNPS